MTPEKADKDSYVEYRYIDPQTLSEKEKFVWGLKDLILKCVGGLPDNVKDIKIVEVIKFLDNKAIVNGSFWLERQEIAICRSVLISKELFLGTLLHELAHAKSGGAKDASFEFEDWLTKMLGYVASSLCAAYDYDISKVREAASVETITNYYVKCVCPRCHGNDFETNEDKSYARCKECGEEFLGGYNELVDLNRKMIERDGLLNVKGVLYPKDFKPALSKSLWLSHYADESVLINFEDTNHVHVCWMDRTLKHIHGEVYHGEYTLNGNDVAFHLMAFKEYNLEFLSAVISENNPNKMDVSYNFYLLDRPVKMNLVFIRIPDYCSYSSNS